MHSKRHEIKDGYFLKDGLKHELQPFTAESYIVFLNKYPALFEQLATGAIPPELLYNMVSYIASITCPTVHVLNIAEQYAICQWLYSDTVQAFETLGAVDMLKKCDPLLHMILFQVKKT